MTGFNWENLTYKNILFLFCSRWGILFLLYGVLDCGESMVEMGLNSVFARLQTKLLSIYLQWQIQINLVRWNFNHFLQTRFNLPAYIGLRLFFNRLTPMIIVYYGFILVFSILRVKRLDNETNLTLCPFLIASIFTSNFFCVIYFFPSLLVLVCLSNAEN